jgi:hypothetical protein
MCGHPRTAKLLGQRRRKVGAEIIHEADLMSSIFEIPVIHVNE